MVNQTKIAALCEEFGFDELTAWRHLRDRERARKLFEYQRRARIMGAGDNREATEK